MTNCETDAAQMPHEEQAQGSSELDEIQFKLDLLSLCDTLYKCIYVSNMRTWELREVMGEACTLISNSLWAQGILASYDRQQQRFVIAKRLSP